MAVLLAFIDERASPERYSGFWRAAFVLCDAFMSGAGSREVGRSGTAKSQRIAPLARVSRTSAHANSYEYMSIVLDVCKLLYKYL